MTPPSLTRKCDCRRGDVESCIPGPARDLFGKSEAIWRWAQAGHVWNKSLGRKLWINARFLQFFRMIKHQNPGGHPRKEADLVKDPRCHNAAVPLLARRCIPPKFTECRMLFAMRLLGRKEVLMKIWVGGLIWELMNTLHCRPRQRICSAAIQAS